MNCPASNLDDRYASLCSALTPDSSSPDPPANRVVHALAQLADWQVSDLRDRYYREHGRMLDADVRSRCGACCTGLLALYLSQGRALFLATTIRKHAKDDTADCLVPLLCCTTPAELSSARSVDRVIHPLEGCCAKTIVDRICCRWSCSSRESTLYRHMCLKLLSTERAPESTPVCMSTVLADATQLRNAALDLHKACCTEKCAKGKAFDDILVHILCLRSRLHLFMLQREYLARYGRGLDHLIKHSVPCCNGRKAAMMLLWSSIEITAQPNCACCDVPCDGTPPPSPPAPPLAQVCLAGAATPAGGIARALQKRRKCVCQNKLALIVALGAPYWRCFPAIYARLYSEGLEEALVRAGAGADTGFMRSALLVLGAKSR